MGVQSPRNGKTKLNAITASIQAQLGISNELLKKLEQFHKRKLRGKIDDTFDLPIKAGQGNFRKDKTTLGVTIKGFLEVVSPPNGN